MSHRNARLTRHGRRLLIERVVAGRPIAHVGAELGISRATGHKWVRRYRCEGDPGLLDRSSRPAERQLPEVVLRPAGDPEHFPVGVKHRYTRGT